MKQTLKTSRLVGLLALLTGFMAFGASAAQAEGTWLKNGVAITSSIPIQAEAESELIILTKVGLSKVEILCTEFKLVGANLEVVGRGSGKIHVQGCLTKLNGTVTSKCKPHSPSAIEGLIETNAVHWLLRLHTGGIEVVEVLPTEAGGRFVTLQLGTGECAIGNNIEVTGKIFLKECNNELLVDKVKHLFEEGPLSELRFGANAMTIDGSQLWFLSAPNLGSTWAGHV